MKQPVSRLSHVVSRATTKTTVLLILLVAAIISLAVNAYLAYAPATGAATTTTVTETRTSNINVVSMNYSTLKEATSTTVTRTLYETTVTETKNDSLSSITVANITTGKFPQSMALNAKTNTLYVMFWNGSTYLAVINANTDNVVAVVPNIKYGALFVNPVTNMVYAGNDIINGSSDRIIGQTNVNASVVALDTKHNLLYASNVSLTGGNNATTTLYKINATTNAVPKSHTFQGQFLGEVVLDTNTDTLFSTDCTDTFACAPSYILAICIGPFDRIEAAAQ